MVVHNPNNWHWVSKNVAPWTTKYLEEHLCKISAEDEGVTAKVDKVTLPSILAEVSQRKGRIMSIYDIALVLEVSGNTIDSGEVRGKISIPGIMYDMGEHEYVYNLEDLSDPGAEPFKCLLKVKVIPQLSQFFQQLSTVLVSEHGNDLRHNSNSNDSTDAVSKCTSSSHVENSVFNDASPSAATKQSKTPVSVTIIKDTQEFRTTSEQLFQTFTDPQRIAVFTRSCPKKFEGAREGGHFELFDGNVIGEFIELKAPTIIKQKWRLAQWPSGHFSTLSMKFNQNDADGVTVMELNWEGVPVDHEEVTKRNWGEYYIQSIKSAFGYGSVL